MSNSARHTISPWDDNNMSDNKICNFPIILFYLHDISPAESFQGYFPHPTPHPQTLLQNANLIFQVVLPSLTHLKNLFGHAWIVEASTTYLLTTSWPVLPSWHLSKLVLLELRGKHAWLSLRQRSLWAVVSKPWLEIPNEAEVSQGKRRYKEVKIRLQWGKKWGLNWY